MILALSVDACVTAVALALAIAIYKKLNIRDIRDLSESQAEETGTNQPRSKGGRLECLFP